MPTVCEIQQVSKELYEKDKILTFKNHINDKKLSLLFFNFYNAVDALQKEEYLTLFLTELLKYNNENLKQIDIDKKISFSLEYIHSNFLKKISLDELAGISNISKYHFLRLFSKKVGITPYKYILNLRLEYARKLLKEEPSTAIIAQMAGFSDESHFIKEFKKYFGFTPGCIVNSPEYLFRQS
ncbi:MAG: helix-turn-helix transcriptional regulator [Epsilonproteobacteria bacterium]|nr:helix-turn-helix transcriptional regulator [Campylobacterota bacterium]